MTMYWIYDLPNWQLCLLTLFAFVGGSLVGLFVSRPLVRRLLGESGRHNDVVSYFFAAIGVFYGLAMGLIAVATWQDLTDVDGLVSKEAAALTGLYRDFDGYPPELRGQLEEALRGYTKYVIETEWPAHRRGETPPGGAAKLEVIENAIMTFEPSREREKIAHAEVIESLGEAVEQRNLRIQAVTSGLPAALWFVVLFGAFLSIVSTYLFWVENVRLHAILVALLAGFIALLVFLTAAMDNPFRGEFSVSPDAFQTALDQVMKPKTGS
jgi:hypothetical protein